MNTTTHTAATLDDLIGQHFEDILGYPTLEAAMGFSIITTQWGGSDLYIGFKSYKKASSFWERKLFPLLTANEINVRPSFIDKGHEGFYLKLTIIPATKFVGAISHPGVIDLRKNTSNL